MNRLYVNRDWSTLKKLLALKAADGGSVPQTGTETGSLVTFETTRSAKLKALQVALSPIQAGSGDPSPENIRPISGRTGVKVWRSGVNMFVLPDGTQSLAGVAYTYDSATNTMAKSGTSAEVAGLNFGSIYFPAGTYTFSADFSGETGKSTRIHLRDAATNTNVGNISKSSPSLTISLDGTYYIRLATNAGETGGVISNFQIERSESQTDYAANKCEAYSVTFPSDPGTVYGGTLDVVSGVLTVDRAMVTLDGTQSISWPNWRSTDTSTAWQYGPNVFGEKKVATNERANIISDRFSTITYNQMYAGTASNSIAVNNNANYSIIVRVGDTSLTTETAINAYLSANPIQMVYELATPLTYNLTPAQIKTLVGTNNVWSDAGDVTVTYYK